MGEYSVVQVGNPVLRRRAAEVPAQDIVSETMGRLIQRMWATLAEVPGVGLAAPQIGEPSRVIVVQDLARFHETISADHLIERERNTIEPYVLINPEISPVGDAKRTFFEGCLSIEGYVAAVDRHLEVDLSFVDPAGQEHRRRVRGWHARILQHEVDHLDGRLYVDRMNPRTFCAQGEFPNYAAMPVEDAIRTLVEPGPE
jgi:peptide deformylase